MKQNRQIEDYLKTIYRLQENSLVRGVDIARTLGVSKPTVSVALKKMESFGLVDLHRGKGIELSEAGEKIAREVTQRYDTIYGLLTELGVDEAVAHEDACRMEHGISDSSLKALIGLRQVLMKNRQLPPSQSLHEKA